MIKLTSVTVKKGRAHKYLKTDSESLQKKPRKQTVVEVASLAQFKAAKSSDAMSSFTMYTLTRKEQKDAKVEMIYASAKPQKF